MIFSKNIRSIALLEAELTRLRALYSKALETKNEITVKSLRKSIKLLQTRMTLMKVTSNSLG